MAKAENPPIVRPELLFGMITGVLVVLRLPPKLTQPCQLEPADVCQLFCKSPVVPMAKAEKPVVLEPELVVGTTTGAARGPVGGVIVPMWIQWVGVPCELDALV